MLVQEFEVVKHPLYYLRKSFEGAEMNYSLIELHFLALIINTQRSLFISSMPQFGHNLQSYQIHVISTSHVRVFCSTTSATELVWHYLCRSLVASKPSLVIFISSVLVLRVQSFIWRPALPRDLFYWDWQMASCHQRFFCSWRRQEWVVLCAHDGTNICPYFMLEFVVQAMKLSMMP